MKVVRYSSIEAARGGSGSSIKGSHYLLRSLNESFSGMDNNQQDELYSDIAQLGTPNQEEDGMVLECSQSAISIADSYSEMSS